jgi:hypothetical protein
MSWKTPLAAIATSLILAGTASGQTPAPGAGTTAPGTPGPTIPTVPGSPTPRMPGSPTPGMPGSSTPGIPGPTPSVPCPPGQARQPGSSICMPATTVPPTTR